MNLSETQQINIGTCKKHLVDLTKKPAQTIIGYAYFCSECEKENENKKEEREKKEAEKKEFDGIPKRYKNADIKLIDGIDTICNWLKAGSGFLFIHGGCGCGKTYLSCAIKHKFNIENIKCDLFFSSDIVLKLKESFQNKNDDEKETEFDIIKKCSPSPREEKYDFFAIFDDFGAQKLSEYAIESWYHIVDRRYRNNNKTIFTSNLTLKDISLFMSDRIASRIASGIIFEMSGTDKRLIK